MLPKSKIRILGWFFGLCILIFELWKKRKFTGGKDFFVNQGCGVCVCKCIDQEYISKSC